MYLHHRMTRHSSGKTPPRKVAKLVTFISR
jgi:hypothetical protein